MTKYVKIWMANAVFENDITDFENAIYHFENANADFENDIVVFENDNANSENALYHFENAGAGFEREGPTVFFCFKTKEIKIQGCLKNTLL